MPPLAHGLYVHGTDLPASVQFFSIIPCMHHLKQCIVIGIESGSEPFLRVHLFSKSDGCEMVLKRKSNKRTGVQHLDLFQSVEVVIEQKQEGSVGFLKETHLMHERSHIGKHYAAFECASRFCRAVHLNARHMGNPESIFSLLQTALDAWNTKSNAHATLLKALYRLASEEGFPVRQRWMANLRPADREALQRILTQPLEQLDDLNLPAKVLAELLVHWLTHHQDFLF